jgi:ketosteroid isomerase-like protein
MILFNGSKILLFVAWLAVADARGGEVDLDKALGSLIAAEKAYAKAAGEKGFRDASISAFADDAVIFAPNPVNGKKFWQQTKEDPVITWHPVFAAIARSADLGYTTGPAEFYKSRGEKKPVGFGNFVSIWRKDANGVWKVALDVGSNHAQPNQIDIAIRTDVPGTSAVNPESARADLERMQQTFSETLKDDQADAILRAAAENIRLYRRDALPTVGQLAAGKLLSGEHVKTTRTLEGKGMSAATDLAYEYGNYSSERTNSTQGGIYVSIWRLDPNGDWKLALDLQKSAPEKK